MKVMVTGKRVLGTETVDTMTIKLNNRYEYELLNDGEALRIVPKLLKVYPINLPKIIFEK